MTRSLARLASLAATGAAAAAVLTAAAPAQGAATAKPEYTVVDLGAVTSASRTEATAINDRGVVVGDSFELGSPLAATVWRPDAKGHYQAETLPNLSGGSVAADMNDAGQIVGYSGNTIPHGERAVLWQNGTVVDLGFPTSPSGPGSSARGINASGQIVGEGDGGGYEWENGKVTALGAGVFPNAINDAGQITGMHSTICCSFAFRALFGGAAVVDLGTLGGSASRSGGNAIDADGSIVGGSGVRRGTPPFTYFVDHAALWSGDAPATDLGTLPGDGASAALAVGAGGTVVGYSDTTTGDPYYHAVIWRDGKITDLNDLIPADSGLLLERAVDINKGGQIVGIGYRRPVTGDDRFDAQHAFLLTPRCDAADPKDTDGDGLPDCWESRGLDADGDGTIDVDLPKMGADPRHKDVFVELDHMTAHDISNAELDKVIAAFDAAPVDNPDGTQGITLHVDNGPDSIMAPVVANGQVGGTTWGSLSGADDVGHTDVLGEIVGDEYDWTAFRALEKTHFAGARRSIFHYAISVHDFDEEHHSGVSANGGDIPGGAGEFIVALGGACKHDPCLLKPGVEAGTFMHELGHNLGLGHGGGDSVNFKPNYLSVMNYRFQFSGLKVGGKAGLYDYSRFGPGLAVLDEGLLDEAHGLGVQDPDRKSVV